MHREIELKAAVPDPDACMDALRRAGARLLEEGHLRDERWDTDDMALTTRDEVLRVREFRGRTGERRATLDWKGPTAVRDGYKMRDEIQTRFHDPDGLRGTLERLGFRVVHVITRDIATWSVHDALARFEWYPRMDVLVEVEGAPEAIERAIGATGIARREFTTERLGDFVRRFEARTGVRASISEDGASRAGSRADG